MTSLVKGAPVRLLTQQSTWGTWGFVADYIILSQSIERVQNYGMRIYPHAIVLHTFN